MAQVTFDFTGKNFIVTGASSGMGRQIALELAEADAKVLAIARRQNELEKLKEVYPENIIPASLDVCDEKNLKQQLKSLLLVMEKLMERFMRLELVILLQSKIMIRIWLMKL